MSERLLVADLRAVAPRWALPDWAEERLRAAAPAGWRIHMVSSPTVSDGDGGTTPSGEVLRAIGNAEVYFGFGISRPLFLAAPQLRWVHSASAGVGSALFTEMLESDVQLTNSAGVHAVPIAEHVLGGILYFLRSFDVALAQRDRRVWDRESFVGANSTVRELGDCRAVIIGAGGVGSEIARRLSALGCHCTGVRRRPHLGVPEGFAAIAGPEEWRQLLPACDLLIIAAPATNETVQMVTERVLDSLPRGAILANVARGSLLDENALERALRAGRIRGVLLDVFASEPLDPASPLWTLSNVLPTPHVSAVSEGGFWRREMALFIDNWHRYVEGRALRNLVDKRAGY